MLFRSLRNFLARVSTIPSSHLLRLLTTTIPMHSVHAWAKRKRRSPSENIHLLHGLIRDFQPFPLFAPILWLGHRVLDLYSQQLSIVVPSHPRKGTALFDQWLIAWKQDMLRACCSATHCIGTDTSFKGHQIANIAVIIHSHGHLVHHHSRPCSAHSSFDGELHALLDAVEYIATSLQGQVIIIGDNEAALCASCDNSPHSGFMLSLQICKLLQHWFTASPGNLLQFHWFPSHTGLEINELADELAGANLPYVNPPNEITTASRRRSFMPIAVSDWHAQAAPSLQARRIQLKARCSPMKPQLWGIKSCQFYDLVGNDINLFSRFVRLISGHAPIGSY